VRKHTEAATEILGDNWPHRDFHESKKGCRTRCIWKTYYLKPVEPQPSRSRSLTIDIGVTAASGEDVEDPSGLFTVCSCLLLLGNAEVLIAVYNN
jgi:hypothetical protein